LLRDLLRDFRLDREDIRQLAIVTVRPEMCIRACIDELGGHADAVSGALDAAFEDVRHFQRLRDLGEVTLLDLFVLHHARAADDLEVGHLRQRRQNFVLHAISEERVLLVFAQILERQDGNRLARYTF
jgi:hypothetical protein